MLIVSLTWEHLANCAAYRTSLLGHGVNWLIKYTGKISTIYVSLKKDSKHLAGDIHAKMER